MQESAIYIGVDQVQVQIREAANREVVELNTIKIEKDFLFVGEKKCIQPIDIQTIYFKRAQDIDRYIELLTRAKEILSGESEAKAYADIIAGEQ